MKCRSALPESPRFGGVPKQRGFAWRTVLVNVGLSAVVLVLAAAAIEAVARFTAWRELRRASESEAISRFHPLLGWSNVPGVETRIRRDEFDVVIRINSLGQRGPERGYEKPAGTRRVLILGDSFAEGYYVPEEASARAVLEGYLNKGGCGRDEVLTGGTAGYSTDQELLLYRLEGRRYRPDLVVVFFFGNDLYFNTTGIGTAARPKPYFDLASRWELLVRNSPVPEPSPEIAFLRSRSVEPWRGSMALRFLSLRTSRGHPELHRALSRFGLVEPLSFDPPLEFLPFCSWNRTERWAVDDMWNRTSAILRALKADVESDGGRLAVLYVPYRFEVNDGAWDLTRRRYRKERTWDRDAVIKRLSAHCSFLGIPVIDPREGLRPREASPRPAYFPLDGHWNDVGHAEAARALFAFMRAILPCVPSRAESERTAR